MPGNKSLSLLITDQSASVLKVVTVGGDGRAIAYDPFGLHMQDTDDALSRFNGQPVERVVRAYILGNGYRLYSSVLRRFTSPDSLSPLLEGGLNGYAYCSGDPLNNFDPSGHAWVKTLIRRKMGISRNLKLADTPGSLMPKGALDGILALKNAPTKSALLSPGRGMKKGLSWAPDVIDPKPSNNPIFTKTGPSTGQLTNKPTAILYEKNGQVFFGGMHAPATSKKSSPPKYATQTKEQSKQAKLKKLKEETEAIRRSTGSYYR